MCGIQGSLYKLAVASSSHAGGLLGRSQDRLERIGGSRMEHDRARVVEDPP